MRTISFAEYELKRYTAAMGVYPEISLNVDIEAFDTTNFFQFNPKFDDAFKIKIKNGTGTITATNERAVLLGVYHFLKTQGCSFIHPEVGGEIIPHITKVCDVDQIWYAKTRHRGFTDGVTAGDERGFDIILKHIDWLPKMMANSFFTELTDYYSHYCNLFSYMGNPYKKPDNLTREQFEKNDRRLVEEMQKRGLIRHGAGHGWTVELMGLNEIHRTAEVQMCEHPEILAQINGERKYYMDSPLFSNLCYSNPKVRQDFAKLVYDYSVSHPEIDVIHVWLGDQFSNFCECDECKKLTPTDWYVKILNEIDEIFTRHGSDKKIGFLTYFELCFPPTTEHIVNQERFILMFAPYQRNFRQPYRDVVPKPYTWRGLNTYTEADMDASLYLAQLKDWKKAFTGDSFVFDYTFFEKPSNVDTTNVLYANIPYSDSVFLPEIGLNGRIECGGMRCMSPTALNMHADLLPLFYGDISYENFYNNFFTSCYGEGEEISDFLEEMAKAMPYDHLCTMLGKKMPLTPDEAEKLTEGRDALRRFRDKLFEYNPDKSEHRLNCFYFREYLDILEFIQTALLEKTENTTEEETKKKVDSLFELTHRKEAIMPAILNARAITKFFQWLI